FATLLSRCQPVRFKPLSDEEMKQCLTRLEIPAEDQIQLIEMALGSPGHALHMNRDEYIEAVQSAEHLWQKVGTNLAGRMLQETGGRKAAKPTRADIEQQVQSLLVPATRALRSGDPNAAGPVRLIEGALQQLRQNVQPALVYENLLLQLAKANHA